MTDNPTGVVEHLRPDDDPAIVAVDGRGRIALGPGAARLYIRRDEPDGVIVLIPAVVLPASTVAGIDSFIADPSTGTRRTRPGRAHEKTPSSDALRHHLRNAHCNGGALDLTDDEAFDDHDHEHRGPGTIRNHDRNDLDWTADQESRMDKAAADD